MDITNLVLVPVIMGIIQAVKAIDKSDKLKDWYGHIALGIAVFAGFGYSYLVQGAGVEPSLLMAAATYGAVQAAWVAKESTGVKIPGDVGTGG